MRHLLSTGACAVVPTGVRMKMLLLVLLGASTQAAGAAPVSLECNLSTKVWRLVLNEQAGFVDWSVDGTGLSDRVPAVFEAELVRFNVGSATVEVSRVDLSLRTSVGGGAETREGKCRIATRRKRVF